MEPPRVEIASGSPTPAEVRAVEAAILALWREDVARAEGGMDPWLLAARAEGTRRARDLHR